MTARAVAFALLVGLAGAGLGASGAGPGTPTAAEPTASDVLARVREYLADWQDTLTSLVADEDYAQEVSLYRRASSGRAQPLAPTSRRLRSEMLLLRAPADDIWLSFRDVIAVDGRAVTDRQKRFDALFAGPAALIQSTAERIAQEGARYNLGRLPRTLNTPTATLVFLQPRYEANTTWSLDTRERLDGRPVWALRFEQRKPPFAVTVPPGVGYPSSGRFWVEPRTGRIVQTELVVRARVMISRVRAVYGAVPSVREGWVPLRMQDEYDAPDLEQLRGVATYSNHRLFRTSGRIVGWAQGDPPVTLTSTAGSARAAWRPSPRAAAAP